MDENKKSYYAIIPANVRYDKSLKANAKLLYGEITALCNEKGYCWASNNYFAELYEVALETVSRWISQLNDKQYINSVLIYKKGSKEIIERRIYLSSCQNNQEPIDEIVKTSCQNNQEPIDEIVKDNTTLNTTFNNKERGVKPAPSKFIPPTIEQVTDYCKEKGYGMNPAAFMHHYESNGWKVGKNKMSSWKSAVSGWELREKDGRAPGYKSDIKLIKGRNAAVESMPAGMAQKIATMFDNIEDDDIKKIGAK